MEPRYSVGIDLGTTNSALAYADLNEQDPAVRVFEAEGFASTAELTACGDPDKSRDALHLPHTALPRVC